MTILERSKGSPELRENDGSYLFNLYAYIRRRI